MMIDDELDLGVIPGSAAIATENITRLYWDYMAIENTISGLEEKQKNIRDKICDFIGNNETLIDKLGNPLVTWKETTPKRFDKESFDRDHPGLYEKYKKKDKSQRSFLPKQKLC